MRWSILFLIPAGLTAACINEVNLPIRSETPILVVDGVITNEAPPYTIRLSRSGTFSFNQETPEDEVVQNAVVTISDDRGRSTPTIGSESRPGYYLTTDSTFRGQVGRSYTLSITLPDGKRYVSRPETMRPVPPVDSLYAQLVQSNTGANAYQYFVYLDTKDPASERNYYRWAAYSYTSRRSTGVLCCLSCTAICFDRCWTQLFSRAVNIADDEATNGNTIADRLIIQSPVFTPGPTLVEVQQYSLTQEAYGFWKAFQEQSTRVGSIFDPLPGPIIGNVVNAADPNDRALGYFGASAIARKRLRITGEETYRNAPFGYFSSLPVPFGDCRRTYGADAPVTEPPGW
ncbi:DUF4249 domain-containing protein [Larkinella soli]|uniref:DUF4249 domain-containing protein n=1 Tax=Larkinella soli TaxID=1770527 RepID=UPI000FFB8C8A|nr:DUF4249 domain-containing protein [Larkinella soli]